jgi:AraC-like DNA-binding protein
MNLPGQLPHHPPSTHEQRRILCLHPYVREAQEVFRPAWHLKPRKLFDFLLVHIQSGTGRFTVAETAFDVAPGDLIWIPPDTLHEMRGHAPGTQLQYIHFDLIYDPARSHWSASVPGGTTDLGAWPGRMHPPVHDPVIRHWQGRLPPGNPAVLTETLRRIILERNRAQRSGLTTAGLVCQLLGHLLDRHPAAPLSARHIRSMDAAMQYIRLHCNENISVGTLARQHGLSPTHFRKLFREHFKQSPREALLTTKMRMACDYLIYTDLNVSEIAEKTGFSNVHNFSRAFRKVLGRPPTAYRSGRAT